MEEEDINESMENKNLLEGKHGPRDLKKNARDYLNRDCIDTLNEKCKRQKMRRITIKLIMFTKAKFSMMVIVAENGQPAQLQKTDVCMTVDVYAASRGGTGSICTSRSSCTNTADSPLKSTRISTELGASECQKPVSTSKPIKISCASQGTTTVKKKASATSAQGDGSYETLQPASEYSPESTSPSSGAYLPKKKRKKTIKG
ncbi:hypothetical protein DPMN_049320 [Dreissena polymorpha]|uniref:Uncharacterized protein n=1 Tax=Dreissena polymorpha TaxID=45954 RepID=A0A9D4CFP3_DREPO|nr:hypothetical protein DPMN_049320 [Dreissena polymorpha]